MFSNFPLQIIRPIRIIDIINRCKIFINSLEDLYKKKCYLNYPSLVYSHRLIFQKFTIFPPNAPIIHPRREEEENRDKSISIRRFSSFSLLLSSRNSLDSINDRSIANPRLLIRSSVPISRGIVDYDLVILS